MKSKIILAVIPAFVGILAVLTALFGIKLLFQNPVAINASDKKFFLLFVPAITVCAFIVQYLLVLPFLKKFKIQQRIVGMSLFQFMSLITLIGGVVFGFIFWERSYGVNELIWITLTGIVAFAIYWTCNLIVIHRLDGSSKI